jgi:hypothetical protein
MTHLFDSLAAHRVQRAKHRQLEHELAAFTSPSDRLEIETIADRYSDDETREIRAILSVQAA